MTTAARFSSTVETAVTVTVWARTALIESARYPAAKPNATNPIGMSILRIVILLTVAIRGWRFAIRDSVLIGLRARSLDSISDPRVGKMQVSRFAVRGSRF